MAKLTKQFIESEIQLCSSGQRIIRDDNIRGFAVRVTTKSKSFIFEKRVDGKNYRITIGKCSEISLEAAKSQACVMLGNVAKGCDPRSGKRINTVKDITLQEVLEKFLEVRNIRSDTQRNYHFAISKHFKDWLDMPIASITKDMVEKRHHDLTVTPNRLGTSGHGRANNALKKLSALINFAADRYGTDDEPLIKINPVSRLSKNRSWFRIYPRQGIIPDSKLRNWYRAVLSLQYDAARDFFIFLLLTGMRCGETRKLKWSHVDFVNSNLIVPKELTKSNREHILPLSDFLLELLRRRRVFNKNSDWIFQSSRIRNQPISGGTGILRKVRAHSGIQFTFHDLRRTFLTMGEKLDLPTYALKRLVNHSVSNDMTGRYLILDLERLRLHMTRITETFLLLLGANAPCTTEWQATETSESPIITQLRLNLEDERFL